MKVVIADWKQDAIERAKSEISKVAKNGSEDVVAELLDVQDIRAMQRFKETAYKVGGRVDIAMFNAGTSAPSGFKGDMDAWNTIIGVNFYGVLNGVQTFVPDMLKQGTEAAIINTGSKQGITCPPGNPAYNTSKAAVKALTEALAHDLRTTEGSKMAAHLLVPGWVFTGLTSGGKIYQGAEKPAGAWTAEQTVEYGFNKFLKGNDAFYAICPDNDVSEDLDKARMEWTGQDIPQDRPPLSRWHPEWADKHKAFVDQKIKK